MSNEKYQPGGPMPKDIGRCADLYADVRELRLAMEKEVAEVKKRENEIKDHIIENLDKTEDTGAMGLSYSARVVTKPVPKIGDWGVFTSWIRKNDRFDMLQKRLSEKAVKDFWEEEDRDVPGVEKFNHVDLSIRKL